MYVEFLNSQPQMMAKTKAKPIRLKEQAGKNVHYLTQEKSFQIFL